MADFPVFSASLPDLEELVPQEERYGNGSELVYTTLENQFGLPFFSPAGFTLGDFYTSFHGFPLVCFPGDTLGLRLGYSPKRDLHFFSCGDFPESDERNLERRALAAGYLNPQKTFFWLYQIPMISLLSYDSEAQRPAHGRFKEVAHKNLAIPSVIVKKRVNDVKKALTGPNPPNYFGSYTMPQASSYLPAKGTNKSEHFFYYHKHCVIGHVFDQMAYDRLKTIYMKVTSDEERKKLFFEQGINHYCFDTTVHQLRSRNLNKILKPETIEDLTSRGEVFRELTNQILIGKAEWTPTFDKNRMKFFEELEGIRSSTITNFIATPFWEQFVKSVIDQGVKSIVNRDSAALKRKAEALQKNDDAKKKMLEKVNPDLEFVNYELNSNLTAEEESML